MTRYTLRMRLVAVVLAGLAATCHADDASHDGAGARAEAPQHDARERTGILVPMYVYPRPEQPDYIRLMALKRKYESVPICAIANPASGPGETVDGNYLCLGLLATRPTFG